MEKREIPEDIRLENITKRRPTVEHTTGFRRICLFEECIAKVGGEC